MRQFVLLDRDGTVIVERHYLADPEQVALLPNAAEGLRQMREMGLGLAIITNQSGIGRGFFDQARLQQIHDRMTELLAAAGLTLDGLYVCPHTPDDECLCRKPRTGLIELAAQELHFDPAACFVIGDKASDIEMGRRAGATTLLVRTGYGEQQLSANHSPPDYIVDDLLDAAQIIQKCLFHFE